MKLTEKQQPDSIHTKWSQLHQENQSNYMHAHAMLR